jgi:hypothetical protein
MLFAEKADYTGRYDASGIPQLDYHGHIGVQYNPIAIAQHGLGNYNLWCRTADRDRKKKFFNVADWLVSNLEPNSKGIAVWHHHFNWEYRDTLKAPWYSALAQGQGISVSAFGSNDFDGFELKLDLLPGEVVPVEFIDPSTAQRRPNSFRWTKPGVRNAVDAASAWTIALDLWSSAKHHRGALTVYRLYSARDLQLDVNLLTGEFPIALADVRIEPSFTREQ